jgi:sulfur-carrier protein
VSLTILYFAWVRDAVGISEEQIAALPDEMMTPAAVAAWLAGRGGGFAEAFADLSRLRCAVDQQIVAMDASLVTPREIAFFPPVTGG